jgi:hypothetical protein
MYLDVNHDVGDKFLFQFFFVFTRSESCCWVFSVCVEIFTKCSLLLTSLSLSLSLSFTFFNYVHSDKKDHIMLDSNSMLNEYGVPIKRQRITPPLSERVMLYVRQDNEDVYTALHVVPPTTNGLISAVS